MKRDGRKLDRATLEEFRLLALRRVREGEKPSEVVKSLGMNRTSIYRWLKAASGRGKGERALVARRGTGRPPKLTAHQRAQVLRWINGKDPRQYGLDFGLWTRQIVATLIEQRFGVRMGVTAVGRLLARLGLTPQKPLQRAYQRDPEAIERWQRETGVGAFTSNPTSRRAIGATMRTTGNAISQDGSQALIHVPKKPTTRPAWRKVAMPETRNDISAERMNPKRIGA